MTEHTTKTNRHTTFVLNALNWALYEQLSDRWYRVGDREKGLRQFLVQDPDGYLILFGQDLGARGIE
jgi:hypothetical protein